ncbi:MarR family transcriptional regulator [Sphingomonas sp. Leaf357]|uniref:MarR family winged helix-turn-helix transcriptional regulator n=1 Tax=Sphingomonas sp. Leaf357 TaxID=1736350 RepID=UPI0006FBB53C|nr:MarR family winged helix-turn-helix transcriptional regulator [Sphingomonas sp. Leaf357]KQS03868.1 MarR family transcriptional regulator [Sphingomonas sp. Leaf357]
MATLPQDPPDDSVDLGALSEFAGYHLRRASAVFAADFARALEGTGMRQVLFGILSVVAANPDINQGAVGRALGIQRANMVALINELVDRELIERRASKDDRRAFALCLSPAGQAMLDECLARIRVHEEEMLLGVGVADRARLIALLLRIEAKERS